MSARPMQARVLEIVNRRGLHARASAKFVETVEAHDAVARVRRDDRSDGQWVGGDSIMGLLMLAAHKGARIGIETDGPEAVQLLDALEALIAGGFGEEG